MRRRGVDEAWNALEELQQQGKTTDKYTVSRMLMKTVGDGRGRLNSSRIYRGISLVEKFIDLQPKDVDEVLFNALLDTCCRLKDLPRLESTVNRMKELNVSPSPVTLGILVKTYGQAGDLQKVLSVWGAMEKQRGQANAVTYGCMIDACVKCGNLEKAVEIFKGMRANGKHRNTILYTTLIKGYGLEKDLASAMELFREMPKEGVPYNTITFNSILEACVKCGDLAAGEGLLREMLAADSSLEPDLITFSTLLKGYCHTGDLDKALQTAESIKARGLKCDELVYNTLMDGCVKANDITAGVGLFEEMIANGMRPSAITHSILARLYQRAGCEDAPGGVAQLYQHHGIERPSGGERGKGFSHPRGLRSPGGRGTGCNPSPMGSPTSRSVASGHGHERSDSMASFGAMWGGMPVMPGFECPSVEPSAPSTPCGSPVGSPRLGLPQEAFRTFGGVPPLPGTGGDTPYSIISCSPTGGAALDASQSPWGAPLQGYAPQAPAFPFGCGTPVGPMPSTPTCGEAVPMGNGMFAVPMMQSAPGGSPMGAAAGCIAPSFGMMGAPCPGADAAVSSPTAAVADASPTAAQMQAQHPSFFMPMQQTGGPQQQACFDGWSAAATGAQPQQMQPQMQFMGPCGQPQPGNLFTV